MKGLLFIAAFLFSANVFAYTYVTGDKIEFQSESSFVSAVFNKTLCFDGADYHAMITKCVQWSNDGDTCTERARVAATQPAQSTRLRCAYYEGDDCADWDRVSFYQSPNLTVRYYDSGDRVVKTENVTVRSCSFGNGK